MSITPEDYKKYLNIAKKICKGDERVEDLLHDVLIQLNSNEKFNTLPDANKVFFFVSVIQKQYFSKSSYFYKAYGKDRVQELNYDIEIEDEEYYEKPTIEWIYEFLNEELKRDKKFWYNKGIFELYMEHQNIDYISKKTKIPKYSIRATIKEMKEFIKINWIKNQQNGKA